jgi:hypothetical protein
MTNRPWLRLPVAVGLMFVLATTGCAPSSVGLENLRLADAVCNENPSSEATGSISIADALGDGYDQTGCMLSELGLSYDWAAGIANDTKWGTSGNGIDFNVDFNGTATFKPAGGFDFGTSFAVLVIFGVVALALYLDEQRKRRKARNLEKFTQEFVTSRPAATPSSSTPKAKKLEIDRWTIEQFLGGGSFKQVYRATQQYGPDKSKRRTAALAVFKDEANNPENLRIFRQEQTIVSVLSHANTIQLFDWPKKVGTSENWFATNYASDKTLLDLVNSSHSGSRGLGQDRVLAFSRQLVAALSHVHRRGVVHADIKLDNILLSRDAESIYLADFGLAFFESEPETWRGDFNVTHSSPEIHAHKRPSRASDVYALGLVILELSAARAAWQGIDTREKLKAAIINRGPRWDGVPANVAAFIKPLIAIDPEDRPSADAVLQHIRANNLAPWPRNSEEFRVAENYTKWQKKAFGP